MKIQKWIQKSFIIPTNLLKAGMVKVPSEMRGGLEYDKQQRVSRAGLMALIMGLFFLFTTVKYIYGQASPSMVKIVGNKFIPPLKGAIGCCDDPWTGGWDEGIEDNWSLTTIKRLDAMKAHGINFTHFRFGPYRDVGLEYLAQGEPFVAEARKRNIIVEIDVYDNWALANGENFFGHTCEVTQHAPTSQVLNEYVYPLVDRYGKYENVIFNLGNEGFRCAPSREWEFGLFRAIKDRLREKGYGDRYVGSQWNHLGEDRQQFDYKTYGGVFKVLSPEPIPVILTEDDGGRHHPEEWRQIIANAPEGVYIAVWRGLMSWAEEEDTWKYPLPIPNLADCSTPPTGGEDCQLRSNNPNLPSAYQGHMSAAVQEQVAAHPELFTDGKLKGEKEKQQFLLYVTQAMRRKGYCAGIYYADEIAILSPQNKSFGENYDITSSQGEPRWGINAHAATCRPGIIQGGWSDGDNGPFTSIPSGGNNLSFENGSGGDAFNWTEAPGHTRNNDLAQSGSWSLKSTFSGPGGVATYSSSIPVTSNTNYSFSAWIYRKGSAGNAYVDMSDIPGELQLISTGQTGVWQQLSRIWNSGSYASVTLRCVTDGGINSAVWFDSISLMPSQTPPQQLVSNPSFENGSAGNASNWTEAPGHTRSNDLAQNGNWSLKSTFSGPSGVATYSSSIAVTPNTNYAFSAWIYRKESVGNAYVDMSDIPGEVQLVSTSKTDVWQQLSGTWNSGSRTSVTIRCVTDGGINSAVWFDSIGLVAQ